MEEKRRHLFHLMGRVKMFSEIVLVEQQIWRQKWTGWGRNGEKVTQTKGEEIPLLFQGYVTMSSKITLGVNGDVKSSL